MTYNGFCLYINLLKTMVFSIVKFYKKITERLPTQT